MNYSSNCRGCGCNPCNCYLGASYGGCGCGGGCDCNCGRKTVLQQSVSCGSRNSSSRFCTEPLAYLTSNIIVLAAGAPIEIKVSNSSKLYKGEGIQIGDYYFQILEIIDSKTVSITHNGTATPGANITAINAAYGCYQYPIYYVGIVELAYEPETTDIEGLDASFDPVSDSIIDPVLVFTYGYLGPKKIQFNMELTLEMDMAPDFVSIPLPDAESTLGATFSGVITTAGGPFAAVAFKQGLNLLVGLGGGSPYPTEAGIVIQVSGEYAIL